MELCALLPILIAAVQIQMVQGDLGRIKILYLNFSNKALPVARLRNESQLATTEDPSVFKTRVKISQRTFGVSGKWCRWERLFKRDVLVFCERGCCYTYTYPCCSKSDLKPRRSRISTWEDPWLIITYVLTGMLVLMTLAYLIYICYRKRSASDTETSDVHGVRRAPQTREMEIVASSPPQVYVFTTPASPGGFATYIVPQSPVTFRQVSPNGQFQAQPPAYAVLTHSPPLPPAYFVPQQARVQELPAVSYMPPPPPPPQQQQQLLQLHQHQQQQQLMDANATPADQGTPVSPSPNHSPSKWAYPQPPTGGAHLKPHTSANAKHPREEPAPPPPPPPPPSGADKPAESNSLRLPKFLNTKHRSHSPTRQSKPQPQPQPQPQPSPAPSSSDVEPQGGSSNEENSPDPKTKPSILHQQPSSKEGAPHSANHHLQWASDQPSSSETPEQAADTEKRPSLEK